MSRDFHLVRVYSTRLVLVYFIKIIKILFIKIQIEDYYFYRLATKTEYIDQFDSLFLS